LSTRLEGLTDECSIARKQAATVRRRIFLSFLKSAAWLCAFGTAWPTTSRAASAASSAGERGDSAGFAVGLERVSEATRRSLESNARADAEALRALGAWGTGLAVIRSGLTAFDLGDFRRAYADLERPEVAHTQLADVALFFSAEARFRLGDAEGAAAALAAHAQAYPESPWRFRVEFRRCDVDLALGRTAAAIRQLASLLAKYPEYPGRAGARLALADALTRQGRAAEAVAHLRRAVALDPGDPFSDEAQARLVALDEGASAHALPPRERLEAGADLRRRKYYGEAIELFDALIVDGQAGAEIHRDAEWLRARTLWDSERFPEALAAFEHIERESAAQGDAGRARRATRWRGYALERLGRTDEAAAALAAASGNPSRPPVGVVEDIAWVYFRAAQYAKARTWFERLAGTRSDDASKLPWLRAWFAWRLGDTRGALAAFERLARAAKPGNERARYWLGRVRAEAGDAAGARAVWEEVVAGSPLGYYGHQARLRLEELGGAEPPAAPSIPESAAELPLASPLASDALLSVARSHGNSVPELRRALELALVGRSDLAAIPLRAVSDELRAFADARPRGRALKSWRFSPRPFLDNRAQGQTGEWGRALAEVGSARPDPTRGPALASGMTAIRAALGPAFEAVGDAHYARRHGAGRGKLPFPPNAPENRAAWARRFPRAFAEPLEQAATRYGVDPLLLWAFMTVESSYNPRAISRSNARGLMQVMPQTGGLIADRMALRGFSPALLFEPAVVLEMAAWYVQQLLHKFDGQVPLAIASYNAGPHRMASWLGAKAHLPLDVLIEEIPYDEAREYTKKVLRFWALYRRIYRGEARFELSNTLKPTVRDNINF